MAAGSKISDAAKDYAAGMMSGIAMVATGHPFDTVKVHLQTQHTTAIQGSLKFRGATQCTTHILQTEGVRGLYRGATSSFAGVAVESSILFGLYSQVKAALQKGDRGTPELSTVIAAAGIAGAGVSTVLCPTELVKCRLQVQVKLQSTSSQYSGPVDVVLKTLKRDGVRGMFRGLKPTAARESIGNVFYFTTYEGIRRYTHEFFGIHADSSPVNAEVQPDALNQKVCVSSPKEDFQKGLVEVCSGILSGGLAGVVFWAAVLPFDVVKTRIQTSTDSSFNTSIFNNFQVIFREQGIRGLYAGLGPTLVRAFPANAAAIVTWELTSRMLGIGPSSTES